MNALRKLMYRPKVNELVVNGDLRMTVYWACPTVIISHMTRQH